MTPENRQPKGNIYEATILLDDYLEMLWTNQPKMRMIKRVSADLRRMTVKRGMK